MRSHKAAVDRRPGIRVSGSTTDPHRKRRSADRATLIRSDQGCRELVDLGGQDEVVLVQAFDLMGLKGDSCIAPTEADIRVMALRFSQRPDLIHEGERLAEVAEAVRPLNPARLVLQGPVRELTGIAG